MNDKPVVGMGDIQRIQVGASKISERVRRLERQASIPASGVSAWTTIWETATSVGAAVGNNAYMNTFSGLVASTGNAYTALRGMPIQSWYYDPSDYAPPTGRSLQLRIVANGIQNGVTFSASSSGLVFGMGLITAVGGGSGAVNVTFSRVGGTEVAVVPAINSAWQAKTGDISSAIGNGNKYVPTLTTSDSSGSTPTNFAAVVTWSLQYRHV